MKNNNIKIVKNQKLNGIEVYFESKPDYKVITELKNKKFRWHQVKKCWYNKDTAEIQAFLNTLTETPAETTKNAVKNQIFLFDRVKTDNLIKGETMPTNKEIKKFICERFPEIKISCKNSNSSYSQCYIKILQSPYNRNGEELKAIINFIKSYSNLYSYDNNDAMTDYFDFFDLIAPYNLISYEYKQTESTFEQLEDITDFQKRTEQQKAEEEARKDAEWQEYLRQAEKEREEQKKREEQKNKELEAIKNNITIENLTEKQSYFINLKWANLNKNNTLKEYQEEVKNNRFFEREAKITKNIYFNNKEIYNYFCNSLLYDFDFIAGTGGSATDDERIQTIQDFIRLTPEEKNTVKWYNNNCIAVYYNNKIQFVIDAQGSRYARYVGLVEDAETEQKEHNTEEKNTSKKELTPEEKQQQELTKNYIKVLQEEKKLLEKGKYSYYLRIFENFETITAVTKNEYYIIDFTPNCTNNKIIDYTVITINKNNLTRESKTLTPEQYDNFLEEITA